MIKITFPKENYEDKDGTRVCTNRYKVGMFELMDIMISNMAVSAKLSRGEHKTNKKLRAKLEAAGTWKDKDQNALILPYHELEEERGSTLIRNVLELEDAEHELLQKLLEAATPHVNPKYSGLLTDLLDLIDNAS